MDGGQNAGAQAPPSELDLTRPESGRHDFYRLQTDSNEQAAGLVTTDPGQDKNQLGKRGGTSQLSGEIQPSSLVAL